MASLANAVAALPTGPGGGSSSRYFLHGSPRASPRVRFETGLVRFECKDANVATGGKANMPAHMRQLLAIVQRADESAIILPIDTEEASPVSRIEKAEAIKDADNMGRYLKDVSNGYVRGSKGNGVRFTMRMRLQRPVKAIKWDDKVAPTLKKMGIWMEQRTTKSTDPVKIGFLLTHPNFTNQEAMMQDLRKRGLPHVGETRMASMGELVKQKVYARNEGVEGQALVLYADTSVKDEWDAHMMDLMREGKTETHAYSSEIKYVSFSFQDKVGLGMKMVNKLALDGRCVTVRGIHSMEAKIRVPKTNAMTENTEGTMVDDDGYDEMSIADWIRAASDEHYERCMCCRRYGQ